MNGEPTNETPLAEEIEIQPDPLTQVQNIILETAESPEEQKSAEKINARLEEYRESWNNTSFIEGSKLRFFGDTDLTLEELLEKRTNKHGENTATPMARVDMEPASTLFEIKEADTYGKHPSADFLNRLLIKLEVLQPGQTTNILETLPQDRSIGNGPYYNPGDRRAGRLLTKIKGIKVAVQLQDTPRMQLSLSPKTLMQSLGRK